MQIVIDVSVLLKAYFPDEEGYKKAQDIIFNYSLGKLELYAPSLIDYEISNAIWIAYKRGRISFDEAKDIQKKILKLDIKKYDMELFQEKVLDTCKKFNISVYDASYLLLAQNLNINVVTGDKKLFNAVKDKLKNLIWIEKFAIS